MGALWEPLSSLSSTRSGAAAAGGGGPGSAGPMGAVQYAGTRHHDAVDFVDGDRIDRPVVELRHLRRHAPGDRRRPGTCGSRSKAAAQIKAFEDTWRWDETAARAYADVVEAGGRVSQAMQAFRTFLGETDMLAYLAMMAPRLMKLRRVRLPFVSVMVDIVFPFRKMSTKTGQPPSRRGETA